MIFDYRLSRKHKNEFFMFKMLLFLNLLPDVYTKSLFCLELTAFSFSITVGVCPAKTVLMLDLLVIIGELN